MRQSIFGLAPLFLLALAACGSTPERPAAAQLSAQALLSPVNLSYVIESDWKTGFTGHVTITNSGPPLKGWTLGWTFADAQVITSAWNGVLSQTGPQVYIKNASYNAALPTGGTITIGFVGKYPKGSPNSVPAVLNFNGTPVTLPVPTPPVPTPPSPTPPAGTGTPWVMGYYVGYLRNAYPLEAVKWDALTHIVVGRAVPSADGSLDTRFDIGSVAGPVWAKSVVARAHQQNKKALLMLGGAGAYAGFVGAASETNRARFVANLLQVVREYGFDGIDLDWEPLRTKDMPALKALAVALKTQQPALLLTLPVAWVNANFPGDAQPFYGEVAPWFDRINVMSYAMNGTWGGWQSWHSSALSSAAPATPSSLEKNVDAYLAAGVPAEKLGAGIGFFGSCYRGVTGPRQGAQGMTLVADDNAMSYANIVTQYQKNMTVLWDDAAKVPYLSALAPAGPKQCSFVSYEDAQSIALKSRYVRSKGLGGVILWNINEGYIATNPEGQRDPLMDAVQQNFLP